MAQTLTTVREMNYEARCGQHVIAFYELDGKEYTGRICQARSIKGQVQVKCLNSQRWAQWLGDAWIGGKGQRWRLYNPTTSNGCRHMV